jgi:ribosome maturation factor RimP
LEELKKRIEEVVLAEMEGTDLFLVDIVIKDGARPKITVLADGDQGITIDQCSQISRRVAYVLEEEDLITTAYILDVSSPGLDHPLKLKRQYEKNIGRDVKLIMHDGHEKTGKLLEVAEDNILISEEKKEKEKGKKAIIFYEEAWIPLEDINKTFVVISFK